MSLSEPTFTYVRDLLRRSAAIVIGPDKQYLVESRLLPIARSAGHADIEALVASLRSRPDAALQQRVVEAMTTNETSFFRDREPFNALSQVVIPDLCQARASTRRISVWSAACSTGQEAYSIAMLMGDHPQVTAGWQVDILGTDINHEMVARAQEARFSQLEVNRGMPITMLLKHFERVDTSFRPVAAIRKMTTFRYLNLATRFDLPAMDVIFLRNVLIYFDAATKIEILARIRKVLRPDGYLFLGGAETTLGLDDGFDRVAFGKATAYRLKGARPISGVASSVPPPVGSPGGLGAAALAMAARR